MWKKGISIGATLIVLVSVLLTIKHDQVDSLEPDINLAKKQHATEQILASATPILPAQPRKDVKGLRDFSLYHGIKDHFDAFLNQQQKRDKTALLDAYQKYLKAQGISLQGQHIALDLFARYIDYKTELISLDQGPSIQPDLSIVEARLLQLQNLRNAYFSVQEYFYLFSKDASYDQLALERLRIMSDKGLAKADKKNLIISQIKAMPEEQKKAFMPTLDIINMQQIEQAYDDDASRYLSIAAEYGPEVADRMEELWKTQLAWEHKIRDYKQFEQTLLQQDHTAQQQTIELQDYLAIHFNDNERKRLRVYLENPSLIR